MDRSHTKSTDDHSDGDTDRADVGVRRAVSHPADCACLRCYGDRYELSRRSFVDTILWSGSLFRRYPSIVVLFGAVAALGYLGYLTGTLLGGVMLFFTWIPWSLCRRRRARRRRWLVI